MQLSRATWRPRSRSPPCSRNRISHFAFCYLVAHPGLDILAEDVVASVVDFVVDHEAQFARLLDADANDGRW